MPLHCWTQCHEFSLNLPVGTMSHPSQDKQCPSADFNRLLLEYKSTTWPIAPYIKSGHVEIMGESRGV
jgi:hypothetical protein